jgi:hypothetical protein
MVRAVRERWRITQRAFDIDARARGQALYRIEAGSWVFDFPVDSFEFSPVGRTGRIIGRSWDMMAALPLARDGARQLWRQRAAHGHDRFMSVENAHRGDGDPGNP